MNDQDKIICTCANLSEKKINNYFESKNYNIKSFDEFLNDTKAGTFCTACRLDLETIFIKKNLTNMNYQKFDISSHLSFKKRLYSFIDGIFPKITLKNQNYFPILHIKDNYFNQSIWITNMEIISENLKPKIKIDDVEVIINLFNSVGKKVWTNQRIVHVNSKEIFEIPSEKILDKNLNISLGWVEVLRKFKLNCSKGTTRPQIMIYSKSSNCAVHGQDVGYTEESSHSSLFRPNIDFQILSFINPTNKTVELTIEPPFEVDQSEVGEGTNNIKLKIPPRGSKIHNLNEDQRFENFDGKYFTINWKGSGKYKTHVYCVSKNFGYISLDHL